MTVLSFLGDVFINKPVLYDVTLPGGYVFNLEGPITEVESPDADKICLKMLPGCIGRTFPFKPVAVCLGNNHIMDYGIKGFEDTLKELASLKIPFFGAGTIPENCNNPLIISIDGIRVALSGYVCKSTHPIYAYGKIPGVAPIDLDLISKDVSIAQKKGADRIIINLHWGVEQVQYMKPCDFEIACNILDLGVDHIVGHHAHCIQPILERNGKYAFFGLGNGVFTDINQKVNGRETVTNFRIWNNTSLVSHYNLRQGSSNWSLQILNKNQVIPIKRSLFAPEIIRGYPHEGLDKTFQRRLLTGRLRYAASRFLSQPRISKLANIRKIISSTIN